MRKPPHADAQEGTNILTHPDRCCRPFAHEVIQTSDARAIAVLVESTRSEGADRIILVLKRRGHVMGFTGEGINDAPSLHTAAKTMS